MAQLQRVPLGLSYCDCSKPAICNLCAARGTDVSQEFLKTATPAYLVRGTDLFFFSMSNKKMITANMTIAIWHEWIKIIPIFVISAELYFLVCHRILVISYVCHGIRKVENHCSKPMVGQGPNVRDMLTAKNVDANYSVWGLGKWPPNRCTDLVDLL